jgi:hypothetical protein
MGIEGSIEMSIVNDCPGVITCSDEDIVMIEGSDALAELTKQNKKDNNNKILSNDFFLNIILMYIIKHTCVPILKQHVHEKEGKVQEPTNGKTIGKAIISR